MPFVISLSVALAKMRCQRAYTPRRPPACRVCFVSPLRYTISTATKYHAAFARAMFMMLFFFFLFSALRALPFAAFAAAAALPPLLIELRRHDATLPLYFDASRATPRL